MDVIEYLMAGDPSIRWQTLRDLVGATPEEVATERAKVVTEGWGAALLAEQSADGLWDGGVYRPGWVPQDRPMFDAWSATHFSLQQLMDCGPDPEAPAVVTALDRVERHVRWEHDDEPYFEGETEPCINGVALSIGVYFGRDASPIVETLLTSQVAGGGWNCWDEDGTSAASLHSTICALEGLRDWQGTGNEGAGEQCTGEEGAGEEGTGEESTGEESTGRGDARVAEALRRGEEVLLDRRLLFRRATGELIDPRFAMPSYPVYWFYDVLRGLDYFRRAGIRDPRLADAIEVLRAKQRPDGRFAYENRHEGPVLFLMKGENEGAPSRWVTLRALRVLRWWDER